MESGCAVVLVQSEQVGCMENDCEEAAVDLQSVLPYPASRPLLEEFHLEHRAKSVEEHPRHCLDSEVSPKQPAKDLPPSSPYQLTVR